jgi:hypothetical protein
LAAPFERALFEIGVAGIRVSIFLELLGLFLAACTELRGSLLAAFTKLQSDLVAGIAAAGGAQARDHSARKPSPTNHHAR